ncbi:MAG: hypothetical protein ACRCV5_15815 [Afipia sp.]
MRVTVSLVTSAEKRIDTGSTGIGWFQSYVGTHVYLVINETGEMLHCVEPKAKRESYAGYLAGQNGNAQHIEVDRVCVWEGPLERVNDWWETVKDTPYKTRQMLGFFSPLGLLKRLVANGRAGATCQEFISWFMVDVCENKAFEDFEFKTPYQAIMLAMKGSFDESAARSRTLFFRRRR